MDASGRIGTGHMMRCLTLADALVERGASVRFVCRPHPGAMTDLVRERGIAVHVLPEVSVSCASAGPDDYADWLGVTQTEDAQQTIEALNGKCPDWLIVDHYGLGSTWERMLSSHRRKLMVIDDLADRRHECDLLLDQNYSDRPIESYRRLVPEDGVLALGPRYALLRPEYRMHGETWHRQDGAVRRVLVFFGGSDQYDLTGRTLEALSSPDFSQLEVHVVIGRNNLHRASLERAIGGRPHTHLHGHRPHLADLMAQADIAIGAGGTTTWERMCRGLPSLVVSTAENQVPACEALARAGLARYLGRHRDVQAPAIARALAEYVCDPLSLADISARSQLAVDGLGTLRVVEYLDPTPTKLLRLRPARPEDIYLYFSWANDPEVRRQAIRSDEITLDEHREWFAARLASTQSHLMVMCSGELPVGQIRFDREGMEARISYSVDPLFRGRGLGKQLVALGLQELRGSGVEVFRAEVKESNIASRAIFDRLGFDGGGYSAAGLKTYRYDARSGRLPTPH